MVNAWGVASNIKAGAIAISNTPKTARKKVRSAILDVAKNILLQAVRNAPAVSGKLRQSRKLTEKSRTADNFVHVIVSFGGQGTGVDYAQYVELGTSFQSGQFFLLRAVKQYQKDLGKLSLKAFSDAWDENVKIANFTRLI